MNVVKKLRNRYKIIDKLVYAIKVMLTKRLALDVPGDEKYMFEKDIINLLKKYNLYSKKVSALQNVKIVVDVDKIPKVDMGYLIIDRLESKEE